MEKHRVPIQSTAGAIPTKNEKGQVTMEKVKVSRYVAGKRPEFAPDSSDDEEDVEFGLKQKARIQDTIAISHTEAEMEDRRLRRLQERHQLMEEDEDDDDEEDRIARRRRLHEPEVLAGTSDEEGEASDSSADFRPPIRRAPQREEQSSEEEEEEEEEELEEEEIERRRALLRQRVQQQQRQEEEVLELEEEGEEASEGEGESSSEYEEYTDSEEEDTGPRLKPVFVRKKDRVTIQEKEKEEAKQRQLENEMKRLAEQRRRQTLKIVEQEVKKELKGEKEVKEACDAVDSGDEENDEEEYEAWKIRELKRIKRDRDERENQEKERMEVERLRNLTEEERRQEAKNNPKTVTNKASKGKYRFLQKYYHRGAFFLDEEEDVYKRDFSLPTLDDHFNKTVLPKVMQVKNFGRSGRTKYTHLVDQDTTEFESPWVSDTTMNLKFHTTKGGGTKQVFDRPSTKKRK